MIAFHFPPQKGSSGAQRTLRFVQHLPRHGWQPVVLTAAPGAYAEINAEQLDEIPVGVPVVRARALDASRHLAVGGKYFLFTALPDRYASWIPAAVLRGLAACRRHRPAVLWSTSPIPSAQFIGWALHRLTGLPWVADLRDPLTGRASPSTKGPAAAMAAWIEQRIARHAAAVVFTTDMARLDFAARHPATDMARLQVVENGFDEADFSTAEAGNREQARSHNDLVLLHSGLVSDTVRAPRCLLEALAARMADGEIPVPGVPGQPARRLRVVFRGSQSETHYRALSAELGLTGVVEWLPALPYVAALREMLSADGLLVMQGEDNDSQVPAKVYEYARAGRPVLALAGAASETRRWLVAAGQTYGAPLEDTAAIGQVLDEFLPRVARGELSGVSPKHAAGASRAGRTGQLARLLDSLSFMAAPRADESSAGRSA